MNATLRFYDSNWDLDFEVPNIAFIYKIQLQQGILLTIRRVIAHSANLRRILFLVFKGLQWCYSGYQLNTIINQ